MLVGIIDGHAGLYAEQVEGGVAGFEEGFNACGEDGGWGVRFHGENPVRDEEQPPGSFSRIKVAAIARGEKPVH